MWFTSVFQTTAVPESPSSRVPESPHALQLREAGASMLAALDAALASGHVDEAAGRRAPVVTMKPCH